MDGNPDVDMYCNMHKWGASRPIARLLMGDSPKTQYMGNCPDEVLVGCNRPMQKVYSGKQAQKGTLKKQNSRQARGRKHFDKHSKNVTATKEAHTHTGNKEATVQVTLDRNTCKESTWAQTTR